MFMVMLMIIFWLHVYAYDYFVFFYLLQLNDIKSKEDLSTFLLENPNVRDAMSVSGWVRDITVSNKGYAGMNLLVHEALTKRKVALDQLRKGLDCLDVLSLIQNYPDLMRVYFVQAENEEITPDNMVQKVFQNASSEEVSAEKEQARMFFLQSLKALYEGKHFIYFTANIVLWRDDGRHY